jgi:AcrR family transcriptional regulator
MSSSVSGSSVRSRRRNPRGAGLQLRDDLVRAATTLLSAGSPVTLRAVAREVGIAPQSIYAHFDDPDQIVRAVVSKTFDLLQARLEDARRAGSTPRERLMAACRAYVAFGSEQPALYAILFGRPRRLIRDGDSPADAEVADLEGASTFGLLLHGIQECVDDGTSSAESVLDSAVQLWVALHGLVGLRANEPDFPWPDPDRTETELVTLLARLHDPL